MRYLTVEEVLNAQTTLLSRSPPLQIAQLNRTDQLPPGDVSLGLLMAEQQFAMKLEQDVMNTPLSSLGPVTNLVVMLGYAFTPKA